MNTAEVSLSVYLLLFSRLGKHYLCLGRISVKKKLKIEKEPQVPLKIEVFFEDTKKT